MDGLRARAAALADELTECRRDLHRNPELGFEVHRTAGLVTERLRALGAEVRTGVGRTGVVGILRAERAAGPAVLLRADMDALPVQEVEGRPYGSLVPGRMHACGHDGHTAMLLGAATLLASDRARLPRDVVLLFQPAEEGGGGAEAMLGDGALDLVPVGSAYALHLWSSFPAGTARVRVGPIMAAQDEFTARIRGRAGHGALPHEALDPILAAAHALTSLQAVISRSLDPVEPGVVTVGSFHAGTAPNVIPEEAVLEGTLRSFAPHVREMLRRRVREVLEGTAAAHGCTAQMELRPGYPAVVNAAEAVARVRDAGRAVFGPDGMLDTPPLAAAEDFAYFAQRVPAAFVLVGAGNAARGITAPHHASDFDLDESVLPLGAELLARIALMP
ncbi:MAG TPA: amidohydrolase [Candidatus Polarisedimenticolaceae bacterium]|nr:amidohydrolase [Candidatus Polarisedimenticolaceae bacterium]